MGNRGQRPKRRRRQDGGSVRAPKRLHAERQFGCCDVCKFPDSSDGQEHHSDCPLVRHCDEYIDDPASPVPLRAYLTFARAPAHGQLLPKPHPKLFADHEGKRFRVTMASRFGDVGITTDMDAELGYEQRVHLSQLSNFSEVP